ncbi:hypothetical protein [Bacillus sp. SG-1]|uniref:hypothetical protein n=1 Tax=Bacillus sp. SG-1 TaxID=161544 RepID=UPI0001543690|nr:hypothetical protein [Bacillus sp. SG-1]EDL65658.1 hypothetical protein BSG1_12326 [Bacillus sp. SG-1]
MKKLKEFSAFQWIIDETEPGDFDKWKGSRVLNFIPHRFSHYCKIMHPFYLDHEIKDKELLWSQCDPDEDPAFESAEPISFKELAQNFNLQYTKEFSSHTISHILGNQVPRYMIFPHAGTMERKTVEEISPVLQSFTSGKCCFQYDLLAIPFYREDHSKGFLYYGSLDDVIHLYDSDQHIGSPTYWWNEAKDWCLYTDPDIDFTLFGGTKEMIANLKRNDFLECIEVDRDTRVDYKADMENHPFIIDSW